MTNNNDEYEDEGLLESSLSRKIFPVKLQVNSPFSKFEKRVEANVSIHIRGFSEIELSFLQGAICILQRRHASIELFSNLKAQYADLFIIDGKDQRALTWAEHQAWLVNKAVIWIDGTSASPRHVNLQRPVKWANMPAVMAQSVQDLKRIENNDVSQTDYRDKNIQSVLVVDEDAVSQTYLRQFLESLGLEVCVVATAVDAIDATGKSIFGCVLMNVDLREIDGLEACRIIKSRKGSSTNVPVILMTERNISFDAVRRETAGCDAHVYKPLDPQNLYSVLRKFMRIDNPGRTISNEVNNWVN